MDRRCCPPRWLRWPRVPRRPRWDRPRRSRWPPPAGWSIRCSRMATPCTASPPASALWRRRASNPRRPRSSRSVWYVATLPESDQNCRRSWCVRCCCSGREPWPRVIAECAPRSLAGCSTCCVTICSPWCRPRDLSVRRVILRSLRTWPFHSSVRERFGTGETGCPQRRAWPPRGSSQWCSRPRRASRSSTAPRGCWRRVCWRSIERSEWRTRPTCCVRSRSRLCSVRLDRSRHEFTPSARTPARWHRRGVLRCSFEVHKSGAVITTILCMRYKTRIHCAVPLRSTVRFAMSCRMPRPRFEPSSVQSSTTRSSSATPAMSSRVATSMANRLRLRSTSWRSRSRSSARFRNEGRIESSIRPGPLGSLRFWRRSPGSIRGSCWPNTPQRHWSPRIASSLTRRRSSRSRRPASKRTTCRWGGVPAANSIWCSTTLHACSASNCSAQRKESSCRAPLVPAALTAEAVRRIREVVPTLGDDRPIGGDIEAAATAIESGIFDDLVEASPA